MNGQSYHKQTIKDITTPSLSQPEEIASFVAISLSAI